MAELNPISKDEWVAWKRDRVTKALVASLVQRRNVALEEWAEGRCADQAEEHRHQGRVQNLKDIIMYIIEDFDYLREEQNGTSTGSA